MLDPFDLIVEQQRNKVTPTEMLKVFNDGTVLQHVDISVNVLKDHLNYGSPTTSSVKD